MEPLERDTWTRRRFLRALGMGLGLPLIKAGGALAALEAPTPERGMSYVIWPPQRFRDLPPVEDDLARLTSLGVTSVAISPTWYQADRRSTEIAPHPRLSPSDSDVISLIETLHAMGFAVFLRPFVDLEDGAWRGEIFFGDEARWEAWFQSYERFLMHHVDLAVRTDVERFSVGVELERTVSREAQWRRLIARVRRRFRGALTYCANWDGYREVGFWDALDVVGVDAYFDLDRYPDRQPSAGAGAPFGAGSASALEPSVVTLMTAWAPWARQLDRLAARVRRPLLFTEVGLRSVRGASRHPWDWRRDTPISLQEQANYYEATFQVFWHRPWLAGIYWWAWLSSPEHRGPHDPSYSPAGKPAEWVLKRWYTER